MRRRSYSPRPCPHCMDCSDVRDDCDFCNGTGTVTCDMCGPATGFSATVRTDFGDLCEACADHYEQDSAA